MSRRGRRSRTLGDLDASDAEPAFGSRENSSSLLRLANGDSQSGQLNAAGQLEGFGVYYWAKSRDCYRGFFKQGQPDGRGSLTFGRTGDRFCGEWKEGQICGSGKMTRLDGSVTEGRFVDGKANGFCRRTYASTEDTYEGSCRNDVREGCGVYSWARCERRYEGPWKDDCMHGDLGLWTTDYPVADRMERLLRPPAGEIAAAIAAAPRVRADLSFCSKYLGGFDRDMRHGEGSCLFLDGFKYSGEWSVNLFHGYGRIDYDAHYYAGFFANGKRSGQGLISTSEPRSEEDGDDCPVVEGAGAYDQEEQEEDGESLLERLVAVRRGLLSGDLCVDEAVASFSRGAGVSFCGAFENNIAEGVGEWSGPNDLVWGVKGNFHKGFFRSEIVLS